MVSFMKLVLPASRKPVNKYTGISIFCSELKSENLLYFIVVNTGANNTKTSDNTGCTVSYIRLCGCVIEVDPLTVFALYDALCTQNNAEGIILGEGLESRCDALYGELFSSLATEAGEYFISMVMVVIMIVTAT